MIIWFSDPPVSSLELPHSVHDIELERISQYILVTQPHGFTLAWEGHSSSVYIKMSPEYVGRTCGLCGNFNADVQDDLKTSYGRWISDVLRTQKNRYRMF